MRGTITAIAATQWTITTPKGVAFTVTISPATKYGTAKAPATAAQLRHRPDGRRGRIPAGNDDHRNTHRRAAAQGDAGGYAHHCGGLKPPQLDRAHAACGLLHRDRSR